MSKLEELEKMKVPDLKAALKARALNTVGNKKQLIERLLEATSNKSESTIEDEEDDDEVIDDYVLGDGDETTEDEKNSGDLFINEDVMLSPVLKTKPISLIPEKENKLVGVLTKAESGTIQEIESVEPVKVSPTVVKDLTEQERRELRMKRFNSSSTTDQKSARAERFGLAIKGNGTIGNSSGGSAANNVVSNLEKLKMRANRFGTVSSTSLIKNEDKDRVLKRKARFGIGTSTGQHADEAEMKKKRAERFGLK